MKKYLFIALAALGFAACAEKMDDNSPVQKGELEESYIAINLMSADVDTRADDGGLEYGTELERQITTAHFFFFDENGNPFNVVNAPATAPGGGQNHLQLDITPITQSGNPVVNVSDISNAVLILNTYKGIYPKQIVAVLNWTPTAQKSYSLAELHNILEGTLGNDTNGYVMSNSVYMDSAGKIIDAVPLTEAKIKTSANDATNDPIDIYVERTAAKVAVISNSSVGGDATIFKVSSNDNLFHPVGEASGIEVYMQLLGWELYNDYSTSTLLKNIQNWNVEELGLSWNDSPNYRCYWANSQSGDPDDKFAWSYTEDDMTTNGFKTNYGFNVASNASYTNRTTYTYCGENTNGEALRTKVILKGQLKEKKGDGSYSALEIASWYGNDYAGTENLKIAVANSLKYTLVYKNTEGEGHIGIKPGDLEIVTDASLASYKVGFKLSNAGELKEWYLRSSDGGIQILGDTSTAGDNKAKTNEYLLANVTPALVYANGQTYYYVDIEHLGTPGKTAQYGVVRNHVYQISINSIKGYGTPVYSGFSNILTPPEYPEEYNDTYVAARINVLSWKVVQQGVDIETK